MSQIHSNQENPRKRPRTSRTDGPSTTGDLFGSSSRRPRHSTHPSADGRHMGLSRLSPPHTTATTATERMSSAPLSGSHDVRLSSRQPCPAVAAIGTIPAQPRQSRPHTPATLIQPCQNNQGGSSMQEGLMEMPKSRLGHEVSVKPCQTRPDPLRRFWKFWVIPLFGSIMELRV
jgi:hypothetical protein